MENLTNKQEDFLLEDARDRMLCNEDSYPTEEEINDMNNSREI